VFFAISIISCEDEAFQATNQQSEREDMIIKYVLKERNIDPDMYKTTESGMYYYYLNEEPTDTVSGSDKFIEIDYKGKFLYGLTFDQGIIEMQGLTGRTLVDNDSCTALGNSGVIAGWTEAISILKVNEKAKFFIPSSLAYGTTGTGGIPGNATLEFDMEIISSKDTANVVCR
jgi:FKBP-type peptidyl-prolyl cis-trans isomerase